MVSKVTNLALQIVGYVFALGEAMAPGFGTFRRIIAQQHVGRNTPFPFEVLWVNALVQLSYAVRKHDGWGIGVYTTIIAVASAYCLIYLWHSSGENRICGWFFVVIKIVVVGMVIVGEVYLFNDAVDPNATKKRDQLQGQVVLVVTFLLNVSPGMEVYQAYQTHEVGGLDVLLAVALLANAIIATVSAFLPFNGYDLVGGLMGIICAGGQIIVWARCYCHGHDAMEAWLEEFSGMP